MAESGPQVVNLNKVKREVPWFRRRGFRPTVRWDDPRRFGGRVLAFPGGPGRETTCSDESEVAVEQ